MAVELCSEKSGPVMSPRISFSYDLSQSDVVPVEQHLLRSNSSSGVDFNFCIRESYDLESSSADELFSDGKILPTQIKKTTAPPKQVHKPEPSPPPPSREHQETKATSCGSEEKQNSKSFWRFKRSSSLNCGSGYARSLCPIPLLSRSNSTGSATSAKRSSSSSCPKDNHHTHKQSSLKNSSVASFSKSPQSSASGNHQKPPLKKCYGSYGNGVRVNPVLNVPSGNLFGLGSIFFNGKDKNKKK